MTNTVVEDKRIAQIRSYFKNHIVSATLNGLAHTLSYSAVYTSNLLKKLTGKRFSELLQEKRCELSAKFLRETNMSIREVIIAVGYENESFFRKVFKNFYGVSPSKYRKITKNPT